MKLIQIIKNVISPQDHPEKTCFVYIHRGKKLYIFCSIFKGGIQFEKPTGTILLNDPSNEDIEKMILSKLE